MDAFHEVMHSTELAHRSEPLRSFRAMPSSHALNQQAEGLTLVALLLWLRCVHMPKVLLNLMLAVSYSEPGVGSTIHRFVFGRTS